MTMSQFEEAEVLAKFDRSFGDKHEELRLERGTYNGRPTFALRLYWRAEDGTWRWSSQKPTQSGKCWERLNLKARELVDLGNALLKAADRLAEELGPARPKTKDTPERKAARDRFDAANPPYTGPGHGDDIPF
jgi:hypothetical protein